MDNQIFVSVDGDAIGQKVGRASLSDDLDGLRSVGKSIEAGNETISQFAQSHGGEVISSGGDEVNFVIPAEAVADLETLRKDYQFVVGASLSVGCGSKLSEANKALHVAKIRGKDQIVQFDPTVDQEWAKAQQDADAGTATGEAKKIGEAYMTTGQKPVAQQDPNLTDDCPYCQEDAHDESNCKWCQEYDAEHGIQGGGTDDCPACQDYDNKELSHNDGCPMCAEYDAQAGGEEQSSEFDDCPDCQRLYSEASENSPSENAQETPGEQGMETNDQLLDAIDQTPGTGEQTPEQMAQQIDDTQLPQGMASDGNKSVPENFGAAQETQNADQPGQDGQVAQDGDTGQDDGSPQMGDVLQDGLNDESDNIQRQKVIDLVGNALQGFKSNKQVLENLKMQEPQFYTSNIMMLKAMIELCGMLGLQPKREQASYEVMDSAAGNSAQPKEEAPPQVAPQEGAAQPPQQ